MNTPIIIRIPNKACIMVNGSLSRVNANIAPNNEESAKSDPVLVDPICRIAK